MPLPSKKEQIPYADYWEGEGAIITLTLKRKKDRRPEAISDFSLVIFELPLPLPLPLPLLL